MVVSRRDGRTILCRSQGVSPLFELKVELRKFQGSTLTFSVRGVAPLIFKI